MGRWLVVCGTGVAVEGCGADGCGRVGEVCGVVAGEIGGVVAWAFGAGVTLGTFCSVAGVWRAGGATDWVTGVGDVSSSAQTTCANAAHSRSRLPARSAAR